MQLSAPHNYKEFIRSRVKSYKKERGEMTLKKLASLVPMQYTFLSKVLNEEEAHLSPGHLYAISTILELSPVEKDYVFLLRDYEAATHLDLKRHLASKVDRFYKEKIIQAKFEGGISALSTEVNYLLEPLAILTHLYLMAEPYREDPKRIARELSITFDQVKQIIQELAALGFVELDEEGFKVLRVIEKRIHYSPTHPLIKQHQKMMRIFCASEIEKIPAHRKKSFLLSFASDEETYRKIEEKLAKFISDVNALVQESKTEKFYQVNLDLFPWAKN